MRAPSTTGKPEFIYEESRGMFNAVINQNENVRHPAYAMSFRDLFIFEHERQNLMQLARRLGPEQVKTFAQWDQFHFTMTSSDYHDLHEKIGMVDQVAKETIASIEGNVPDPSPQPQDSRIFRISEEDVEELRMENQMLRAELERAKQKVADLEQLVSSSNQQVRILQQKGDGVAAFEAECEQHNWNWQASSDHEVRRRGQAEDVRLLAKSQQSIQHRMIYNRFVSMNG